MKQAFALQMAQQAQQAAMDLQQHDKVTPSLTGTMDPTAVVDLEQQIGLKGEKPPLPTPVGGKPSATGSKTSGGVK